MRTPRRGAAAALLMLAGGAFPLYLALVASLSPEARLFEGPLLWPGEIRLEHYRALFVDRGFWRPLLNSLAVAGATTAAALAVATPCAYALARLRFRGKTPILAALLAASLFPQAALVMPFYLALRALGLIDTYPGLVLPYLTFAAPLAVWLLVGFLRQLPRELEEAAMVDGASRLRVLAVIVLPLAAPGLAATALLTFIYCWNEFLFALSFTVGLEHQTAPVAVAMLKGRYQVPWGQVLAAALSSSAPVAALVLLFQRWIARGLLSGSLRG